ncbi:MAG: hypothetical protein LBD67_05235 [Candidatus Accumulibacter sp.]|jgi:hypothetical protein|nr:hypothetical protein [Accumulibacter sp.]
MTYDDIKRLREGKESFDAPETEEYKKVIMERHDGCDEIYDYSMNEDYEFRYKARRQKDGTLEVHHRRDSTAIRSRTGR